MPNKHASSAPAGGGYEKTDATARPLLGFGAGLAAIIVLVAILMAAAFKYFGNVQSLGPPPAPFATGRVLPPEPRLQPDPRVDLERLRQREEEFTTSYGWVNPNTGQIRIPVDRAMDRLIEKGLPVATGEAGKENK